MRLREQPEQQEVDKKTMLNSTPSHDEFYLIIDKWPEIIENKVDSRLKSVQHEFGHECFQGYWDLFIETEEKRILVEYKNSKEESSVEETIRQINKRKEIEPIRAKELRWYIQEDYETWFISFDSYFDKFNSIFKSNNIEPVILDKESNSITEKLDEIDDSMVAGFN